MRNAKAEYNLSEVVTVKMAEERKAAEERRESVVAGVYVVVRVELKSLEEGGVLREDLVEVRACELREEGILGGCDGGSAGAAIEKTKLLW